MKSPTLKDKVVYYAKVRQANYADSLRLEGFNVASKGSEKGVSTRGTVKKPRRSPG